MATPPSSPSLWAFCQVWKLLTIEVPNGDNLIPDLISVVVVGLLLEIPGLGAVQRELRSIQRKETASAILQQLLSAEKHNAVLSTREKQPARQTLAKLHKPLNHPHLDSPYYDTLLAMLFYYEEDEDAGWTTRILSPLRNLTLKLCQDDHTTVVGCLIRLAVRQWLRDYVWSTWLEKNDWRSLSPRR
jgi:hypothetical protein